MRPIMHPLLERIADVVTAIINVDAEGMRARTLQEHPDLDKAPVNYAIMTVDGVPAGEIGIGRRCPYRGIEFSSLLRNRDSWFKDRLDFMHVAAIANRLSPLLMRVVAKRSLFWPVNSHAWNHDQLYGVTVKVHERDTAIVRWLSELETLNPAFRYQARDVAQFLGMLSLRGKKKGNPSSWDQIKQRFQCNDFRPWLRPHALVEMLLHYRRRDYVAALLGFFAEKSLITPAEYQLAAKIWSERCRNPDAPPLPFVVLSKDAKEWDVLNCQEGMPVLFKRHLDDGVYSVIISERRIDHDRRKGFFLNAREELVDEPWRTWEVDSGSKQLNTVPAG